MDSYNLASIISFGLDPTFAGVVLICFGLSNVDFDEASN